MANNPPLWINEDPGDLGTPAYNAMELRRAMGAALTPGPNPFSARTGLRPDVAPASVSGSTVTVSDIVGIAGTSPGVSDTGGAYWIAIPGGDVLLDPPDGSNPRIDLVVAQVYDDDEDSSGQREVVLESVAGTPAASPTEPALPDGSLLIAVVNVPSAGAASVTATGQFTVAAGGVLPVAEAGDLPTDGLYPGLTAWVVDVEEHHTWTGTEWVVSTTTTPPAGVVAYGTNVFSETLVTSSASGTPLVNMAVYVEAGFDYSIRALCRFYGSDGTVRDAKLWVEVDGTTVCVNNARLETFNQNANPIQVQTARAIWSASSSGIVTVELVAQRANGTESLAARGTAGFPIELIVKREPSI